jgi:hypothetical protein
MSASLAQPDDRHLSPPVEAAAMFIFWGMDTVDIAGKLSVTEAEADRLLSAGLETPQAAIFRTLKRRSQA